MRALFIGAILSKNWPGGEPIVARSIMDGFRQRGVDTHEMGFKRSGVYNRFCSILNSDDKNARYCKIYKETINKLKPDIIIGWFDYDSSLLYAAEKTKTPVIAAVHIPWIECPLITLWNGGICSGPTRVKCRKHILPRKNLQNLAFEALSMGGSSIQRSLKKRKERFSEVKKIIVPSLFMKNNLVQYGLRAEKIEVIYNGITIKPFDRKIAQTAEKNVIFVGPAQYRKGYFDFVKMANLVGKSIKANFLAVGNDLSVGNVKALGFVDRTRLDQIMDDASILVFPSVWDEPFGLVPIEAMVRKKPVVAYATGALPEIVQDGETGFLVPRNNIELLAEKVKLLLSDESIAEKMGQAGQKLVNGKFNLDNTTEGYYKVMNKIAG